MGNLKIKELVKAVNYYYCDFGFFDEEVNEIEPDDTVNEDSYFDWCEKTMKKAPKTVLYCSDFSEKEMIYSFNRVDNCINIFPRYGDEKEFTMKEFIIVIDLIRAQLKADKRHCYEVMIGKDDDPDNYTLYHQESTDFGLWWEGFHKLYLENIDNIKGIIVGLDEHEFVITLEMKEEAD